MKLKKFFHMQYQNKTYNNSMNLISHFMMFMKTFSILTLKICFVIVCDNFVICIYESIFM